jgi:N-acetylneuraminate synthase
MSYLDYKKRIEFGDDEYSEISKYCEELGINWSASAWDLDSLIFLDKYDLPFHKIASALSTNLDFVREVARRKILTYASVGMCTFQDIDQLVEIFSEEGCELVLMHTISNYPAKESDLNLRMIETLSNRYGLQIGYSGHESSVTPSIVAGVLGAVAIERHITLDRAMWGTDHAASLERPGLVQLVNALRKIPLVSGDGIKKEVPGELEMASKMRYWV